MRISFITAKIIEYSNALGSIYVEEYQRFLKNEYADLTSKQELTLELLRSKTRTINELADYFSISSSAASQLISKLEQLGYVKERLIHITVEKSLLILLKRAMTIIKILKNSAASYSKILCQAIKRRSKNIIIALRKIYQIAKETP